MRAQVKISTGRASAARAAKTMGVSSKDAKALSYLVSHSLETGEFELPGVGRLVSVKASTRTKAAGKKTPKYRIVKARGRTSGTSTAYAKSK